MLKLSKAIEDMKKEAEAKGRNEGKIEGVVETEARVKVETVVNFYKNGASLELISKSTKMTIEEVKNILLQNNVELRMS